MLQSVYFVLLDTIFQILLVFHAVLLLVGVSVALPKMYAKHALEVLQCREANVLK